MKKLDVLARRIRALNKLRDAVKKYPKDLKKEKVLEEIKECRRVGANKSMIMVLIGPILPDIPKEKLLRSL